MSKHLIMTLHLNVNRKIKSSIIKLNIINNINNN